MLTFFSPETSSLTQSAPGSYHARTIDSRVDDSEEEDGERLTGKGKRMERAVGKMDQAYDGDDDDRKNPYASSVRILRLSFILAQN